MYWWNSESVLEAEVGIGLFAWGFDYEDDDEDGDEDDRFRVNARWELGSIGWIELDAALIGFRI